MKTFRRFVLWLKTKKLERDIRTGKAKRGRTDV